MSVEKLHLKLAPNKSRSYSDIAKAMNVNITRATVEQAEEFFSNVDEDGERSAPSALAMALVCNLVGTLISATPAEMHDPRDKAALALGTICGMAEDIISSNLKNYAESEAAHAKAEACKCGAGECDSKDEEQLGLFAAPNTGVIH